MDNAPDSPTARSLKNRSRTDDDGQHRAPTAAIRSSARQPGHRRRFALLGAPVVAVAVAALLVGGCGADDVAGDGLTGDGSTTTTSVVDLTGVEWSDHTAEAELTVQTRDNSYLDDYVVVKAGTPITFRNVGRTEHNVLSASVAFSGIEAEDLEPGDEQVLIFDEPGDYPFYCSLHGTKTKGMVGAVRVVA